MPAISSSGLTPIALARLARWRADGEAVRLVAQPLDVIEHRVARLEHEGRPVRACRNARARHRGPAPWRPRHAQIADARDRPAPPWRRRSWPCAAIDQHQIGPGLGVSSSASSRSLAMLLEQPGEPPRQHFAHHGEIVPGHELRERMLNLRYCDFMKPSGPATIMAPTASAALDMRIVIDLDPPRRLRQAEDPRHPFQQLRLRGRFGHACGPCASRALVTACSTSVCFSPRCGTAISTLRPGMGRKRLLRAARAPRSHATAGSAAAPACRHRTAPGRTPSISPALERCCRRAGNRPGCPSSARSGRRTPGCRSGRPPGRGRTHPPPPRLRVDALLGGDEAHRLDAVADSAPPARNRAARRPPPSACASSAFTVWLLPPRNASASLHQFVISLAARSRRCRAPSSA